MKTLIVSFGLIAAMAAAASLPATAAPKKCKAGTTWSKSAGQCVAKRAQKPETLQKAQAYCLSFSADGGVSSGPCAK